MHERISTRRSFLPSRRSAPRGACPRRVLRSGACRGAGRGRTLTKNATAIPTADSPVWLGRHCGGCRGLSRGTRHRSRWCGRSRRRVPRSGDRAQSARRCRQPKARKRAAPSISMRRSFLKSGGLLMRRDYGARASMQRNERAPSKSIGEVGCGRQRRACRRCLDVPPLRTR